MFRNVDDEHYGEAADIIAAAGDARKAGSVDMREASLIAAAALSLEKGAPHALYQSHATTAERYLQQGTREWRFLQGATAHYLAEKRGGNEDLAKPQEGLEFILNDARLRMTAARVTSALQLSDLRASLTPLEDAVYLNAKNDPKMTAALGHVQVGNYPALSDDMQKEFHENLTAPLQGKELRSAMIEQLGNMITSEHNDLMSEKALERKKAWETHFGQIDIDAKANANAFFRGDHGSLSQREGEALRLFTQMRGHEPDDSGRYDVSAYEERAAARYLDDNARGEAGTVTQSVKRMITDVQLQEEAAMRVIKNGPSFVEEHGLVRQGDDEIVAVGRYDEASEPAQDILAFHLATASYTAPLQKLRIEATSGFVETEFEKEKSIEAKVTPEQSLAAQAMIASQMQPGL